MFIASYSDYLTFERRFSPHTVGAYLHEVTKLAEFLDQIGESFDSVAYAHLRSYFADMLETGQAPSSVNRSISALRTYFNYLLRENHITQNPARDLKALRIPRRLPVVLPPESLDQLLDEHETFPNGFEGQRDRLVLEFLYGTGVRLAELLQIRVDQIDFYAKQVIVFGKRNKERLLPLTDHLIRQIRIYLELRAAAGFDHARLFLTNKGTEAYPRLIHRIVHKYLSQVSNQRKRSPHVLRHTFATAMLDNGADLHAIKELLGHAGLSATQVYTHNSAERLKSIYNQAHPRA